MGRKVKPDGIGKLGQLRQNVGLERKDVSEAIGCTVQFLNQIERRNKPNKPSLELAFALCKLYKCKLSDIYPEYRDQFKEFAS